MTEPLRVDTGLVLEAGGRLQSLAAAIPPPPATYSPTGADALSVAIAAKVTEVVDPVIAQLPVVKEELMRYAQNVVNAANTYDTVDRQLAEDVLKRVGAFDEAAGVTSAGSAVAGRGGAAAGAAAPMAAGGQQGGQMAEMMQAPMQMAGMVGAVPQAMGQGVQNAVQQVGQVAEMAGRGKETAASSQSEQAGPANESGERAPESGPTPRQSVEPGPGFAL